MKRDLDSETLSQLQHLDPARDLPNPADDFLAVIKRRHSEGRFDDRSKRNIHKVRIESALAVLAVAVLVLGGIIGGITLFSFSRVAQPATHEIAATTAPSSPPGGTSAESAIMAASPLAAGRSVKCGGVLLSSTVLAASGGAETLETTESQALRAYLDDNPGGFLTAVTLRNWALLDSGQGRAIFGHKTGPVGVDKVASFATNAEGKLVLGASTGCTGPVLPGGDTSSPVVSAVVSGSEVTLHWLNSACGIGAPSDKILVSTEQTVVGGRLHILVVTRANPAVPPGPQSCGGVTIDSTATVKLKSLSIADQLFDDYSIPASRIPLHL